MLDILVAEIVLQGASIVAVIGQLEAAGMAQHVRMDGERYLGGLAEPYHEMVEAHGVIGPPRSLTNTWTSLGFSRRSLRKARISSPRIGCTLGVPRLALRTCSLPWSSSICCH